MTWNVWTKSLAAGACVVLALSGAAVGAPAALASELSPAPESRTYENARVVALDTQARTITVRGGGVGKEETFPFEAEALRRVGALKPGDEVVLTLRAAGARGEVVTGIERSVTSAGERREAGRSDAARRRGRAARTSAPPSRRPPAAPSPAATPAPSPEPPRLPTDIVGPLRDPRVDPNFDPRQNPLRDPRVIPGLSEPAPRPTPTPTPTPSPS